MKSGKKPKDAKEKFNGKYWLAKTMEQPIAYFLVLLVEGYALLFVTAVGLVVLDAVRPYSGAVFVTAFLIFMQTMELRGVRKTPGYILYLARRAAEPPVDMKSDFSYNTFLLRGALRGVVNLGDDFSGHHFQNLLSIDLSERDSKATLPSTTGQVMTAIELSIVEKASKMPRGRANEPFAEFSEAVKIVLDSKVLTVSDLVQFIVSRYLTTSQSEKDRARITHAGTRFSAAKLERLKVWAQLISAIAIIVSGAIAAATLLSR